MIQSFLVFLAVNTASVYIVAQFLTDFQVNGGTAGYVVVGVILGFLNLFLKPILKILSLPFLFLTVGLFTLVVNGVILWLTQYIVTFLDLGLIRFTISGTFTYATAVLLFGIVNYVFHKVFR